MNSHEHNPFASFSYDDINNHSSIDVPSKTIPQSSSKKSLLCAKRRKSSECDVRKSSKPKLNDDLMIKWWKDLKSLTSNYPFAVMVTGILGAQTRDSVNIITLRNLAKATNNDISPQTIMNMSIEEIAQVIKSLNYCHKKVSTLRSIAEMFLDCEVPNSISALLKIPGRS